MGMQLNKDSQECEGRNISKELASAIDKDPALKTQIIKSMMNLGNISIQITAVFGR